MWSYLKNQSLYKGQIFSNLVVPGSILCLLSYLDIYYIKAFNILPLASVLVLLVFSFFMDVKWLMRWVPIYCIFIALTLWTKRSMWDGANINIAASITTRTLSTAAAGVMACFLARMRQQDLRMRRMLNTLLSELKIPVIISDEDGWIVHINESAQDLLGISDGLGKPFFDHFFALNQKGKSIQKYLDLASGTLAGPLSIRVACQHERGKSYPATLIRLDMGGKNNVLAMIYPDTQTSV